MKSFCYLALFAIIILPRTVLSQTVNLKNGATSPKKDTVKQVDLYDIFDHVFKIKAKPRSDTAKVPPGKLLFAFIPGFGYTLVGGIDGSLSANISFYTSDQATTNLSIFFTQIQYSQYNQLVVPLLSRIWLRNNKFQLLGDWRFFSYPSKTYGLEGSDNPNIRDNINYLYIRVHEELLSHFSSHYFAGIGYFYDYHWDVRDYNNLTDYGEYNGSRTNTMSSGLVAAAKYDTRTNSNNPDKGLYAGILYRYNSTYLGSISNWQMVEIEARTYIPVLPKTILALWTLNRFTFGGYVPYLDLPSNGFGSEHYTGRGYIQGRFRGPGMLYDEAELRFPILRNGFLGGVAFANMDSFSNYPSGKFERFYPAGGVGLRFKFNKFSKVNICADYAIGEEGSHGFFFNLGEVF